MPGRHLLQIPGPTNVPDRILKAIARATIDHRGPEFRALAGNILERLPSIFKTRQPVVIFPASGTGAWEAALVNCLSPKDKVLMCETGHFASGWERLAANLSLETEVLPTDWRHGVDPNALEDALARDNDKVIKAVCIVHNETSTGICSDVAQVRAAIDRTGHPALLMVDTISSLASIDYRHDEWGVDVTVAGSQKGLMLPPGLSFNAVSDKALHAARDAQLPKAYWNWQDILDANQSHLFPYTPATNLLFGLREALDMLLEEGLEQVFARHTRLGEATRSAVKAWELELLCLDSGRFSNSLTAVLMPDGHDADAFRNTILEHFDMSLGNGLGRLAGKVFRIGHLGDFNDLMLTSALGGIEMGLKLAEVPHQSGGVQAALNYLSKTARES
jgi:alanine-glyoxylate transaminase/serine-glyoxylate transaminase/serine-pyruvate transaminase